MNKENFETLTNEETGEVLNLKKEITTIYGGGCPEYNKETTLSDCMIKNKTQIPVICVKEFIKKLKEEWKNTKEWNKNYGEFCYIINKLAGEELTK